MSVLSDFLFLLLQEHLVRKVQQFMVADLSVPGNNHFHIRVGRLYSLCGCRPGRGIGIGQIAFSGVQAFYQASTKKNILIHNVADDVIPGMSRTEKAAKKYSFSFKVREVRLIITQHLV